MLYVKKQDTMLCMAFGAIFLAGCWPFGSGQNQVMKKPELVIINVLEKPEFEDCHIAGSINIPFDEFENKIASLQKQNYYVIYCADYMCMSSGYCAKLLQDAGFEHVWAYEGGMAEWYQKGYAYEGPAQLEYLSSESENLSDEPGHVPSLTAQELQKMMQEFGMQN